MDLIWIPVAVIIVAVVVYLVRRDKLRGKAVPDALKPGNPLPHFSAFNEKGDTMISDDLRGKPSVLMFVRGSWCPFCSRQVKSLTEYYKQINDTGTQLILVTPKPLETTRRVADMFDVEFDFWLDESLEAGRKLGLVHSAGVPDKFSKEYGNDTLWPTTIVADKEGVIRHTELSRFVADRPNPAKILRVVANL